MTGAYEMVDSQKFKIALVSPPYGPEGESMYPLGLIALKVYIDQKLGEKVQTEIFDFSDCPVNSYHYLESYNISKYDLVGLCAYSTNFPLVLDWGRQIKKLRKSTKIVIGGPHTTSLSEHIVNTYSDTFDYVIRGEGELVLEGLVESLLKDQPLPLIAGLTYKTSSGIALTGYMRPPSDLNLLPPPSSEIISPFDNNITYYDKIERRLRNAIAFTSSRGCPFRCSFCSIASTETKWRAASAETLAGWIEHAKAIEKKPIEHIYFMDADFMIQKQRVLEVGDMLASRYPEITWSFSGRVDDLKRFGEENLAKLSSQGLRFIESGLESGSQASLDRMNKKVSVQDNLDAISMLRRAGLQITVDFIMFLPDSTPNHIRENLKFILSAGLTEHLPHDHFYTYLLLYPGTPLRTYYEKSLNLNLDLDVLPQPDDLFVHEQTKRIFRLFIREFLSYRLRVQQLLLHIDVALETNSLPHLVLQRLRIESISLRHLPFLVLEELLTSQEDDSLTDAVPWLKNFDDYVASVNELCIGIIPQGHAI